MEKTKLLSTVAEILSGKIANLKNLIDETRSSNNDTKSSMGDKYETGREMLQQEINNLQLQLNGFLKQETSLKNIKTEFSEKIEKGSLVETEKGKFFIAISLGEINFETQKIFVISPESPLAKAMWGKAENDTFLLNSSSQKIEKIW